MVKEVKMTNIFQRIGEAVASQGKITLVAALTPAEGEVLKSAGFKKVGSTDIDNNIIDIYEVKINQVINTTDYQKIRAPIKDSWPYVDENPWKQNYKMYGDSTDASKQINYRGTTTSLIDAAYNPLSILEDYFVTEEPRTLFKIEVPDNLTTEGAVDFINKMKDAIQSRRIQK